MDRQARILIVDDFSSMRRIVRTVLQDRGYHCTAEASDGRLAWAALQAQRFDLVVTDLNMPVMSGLELLRKIRSDERCAGTKVLIVTAEAKREQIVEAVAAGVDDYLVKPFTEQLLRDKIDRIMTPRSLGVAA